MASGTSEPRVSMRSDALRPDTGGKSAMGTQVSAKPGTPVQPRIPTPQTTQPVPAPPSPVDATSQFMTIPSQSPVSTLPAELQPNRAIAPNP